MADRRVCVNKLPQYRKHSMDFFDLMTLIGLQVFTQFYETYVHCKHFKNLKKMYALYNQLIQFHEIFMNANHRIFWDEQLQQI